MAPKCSDACIPVSARVKSDFPKYIPPAAPRKHAPWLNQAGENPSKSTRTVTGPVSNLWCLVQPTGTECADVRHIPRPSCRACHGVPWEGRMAANPNNILNQLSEGTILEGPHWTEPVKVLTAKARGSRIEVQAVGAAHQAALEQAAQGRGVRRRNQDHPGGPAWRPSTATPPTSGSPPKPIASGWPIQYDPHFAVSVSQVDPLPHQMDAVYAHLLTQPRIRFLIADDPGAGKTIMAGLTHQGTQVPWPGRADAHRHAGQPHRPVAA